MGKTDILGFILSAIAVTVVLSLRYLLPRHLILFVSSRLDEIDAIIDRAEAHGLPNTNGYRIGVTFLRNQLSLLRIASHRSPWFGQQLGLAVLSRFSWRIYTLHSQIEDLRRRLEMAIDELQLAPLATVAIAQSAAITATPAAIVAAPTLNLAELPPPPPAAVIRPTRH